MRGLRESVLTASSLAGVLDDYLELLPLCPEQVIDTFHIGKPLLKIVILLVSLAEHPQVHCCFKLMVELVVLKV
jgi:hypothetical protein